MRSFFIYHFPAILCAATIITLSSVPNLAVPEVRFLASDKVAHFIEYAVFAFLVYRSFYHLFAGRITRTFLFSGLFLSFFALIDEMYQRFIPGRFSDAYDFASDLIGAFLVLILLSMLAKRRQRSAHD
jgi:VanZ family protein